MNVNAPKLVLHPTDAESALASESVLGPLRTLEILGDPFLLDGRQHFRTGPGFLEHIAFLGCAPHIELDPPGQAVEVAARTGQFCHLHLRPATPRAVVRLQAGRRPRCRNCGTDVDPWGGSDPEPACPRCGRPAAPERLNWRQAGGQARLFLDIYGVHPSEAVPGDVLLDTLARATGTRWAFFYIED